MEFNETTPIVALIPYIILVGLMVTAVLLLLKRSGQADAQNIARDPVESKLEDMSFDGMECAR